MAIAKGVPGNPIDPKMLSILAASRAAGGAPYTPRGPTGSPFITGGGTPYTPAAQPNAYGMNVGTFGQWALPRPAGVSLGYVPTAQTIGSAANAITPRTLESFLPPPPPPPPPKKKVIYKKKPLDEYVGGRGGSSPNYGGGVGSAYGGGGGAAIGGGVGGFGGKAGYK